MQHFLEISQLTPQKIESLLEKAAQFKQAKQWPNYQHQAMATLFYENSTRTRLSFQLAAHNLAMTCLDVPPDLSSESKGETLEDTLKNLVAMGINHLVIRHKENDLPQRLADSLGAQAHIINAGDGTHAHPSQALLDLMTIREQKPQLHTLKIAILGDIKHSRVAHSLQSICSKLQVKELVLIAPKLWQPEDLSFGRVTDNLAEGLSDADVVICLRVQKERLLASDMLDLAAYRADFALTSKSLGYAKPDAMVMHPGPMNRGLEIDSDVADGAQSFILQQVTNGVYARMAILDSLLRDL